MPNRFSETEQKLLAEIRWYGNAIAGNAPIGGYARAAKDAENRWYKVTLPMLYELQAVYQYQEEADDQDRIRVAREAQGLTD